mmetsp:Transcript_24460/g.35960  ORF Transcript_24460/g.35960 Transcript_24460/m.35960 type:complete len:353 (+) Transcript_24460:85-1143(+)
MQRVLLVLLVCVCELSLSLPPDSPLCHNLSRPVLVKFHKVGSETIKDYFLMMRTDANPYVKWNDGGRCPGLPMDHFVLGVYMMYGNDMNRCIKRSACPNVAPQLVTIVRDPLERYLSALHYFSRPKVTSFVTHYFGKSLNTPLYHTFRKILNTPKEATPSDIDQLLRLFMSKPFRNGPHVFYPKFTVQNYEMVLSRQKGLPYKSTNATAMAAIRNLAKFYAVGYVESMPSLFVLLQKRFPRHLLEDSCFLHNNHHVNSSRESPYTAYSAPVVETFKNYLRNEFAVYEAAKDIHRSQLAAEGYTIESATKKWKDLCATVDPSTVPVPAETGFRVKHSYYETPPKKRPSPKIRP